MNISISIFIILSVIICAHAINCPKITISQTLRTSWEDKGEKYNLYDLAFTNGYTEEVSDIVFTLSSVSSGFELVDAAGSFVTSSWNMQELGYTDNTHLPFTLVLDNKVTTIAAGATHTSAGYIVRSTETIVSSTISCDRLSATATTSSVSSSTTGSTVIQTTTGTSSVCLASAVTTTQSGTGWTDDTYSYTQWSITVTNLGTQNLQSAELTISYDNTFGDFSQMWNMVSTGFPAAGQSFEISLFNLAPGQTFSGAGYIFRVPLSKLDGTYHLGHYSYPYTEFVTASNC